jgi:hypothetical protein
MGLACVWLESNTPPCESAKALCGSLTEEDGCVSPGSVNAGYAGLECVWLEGSGAEDAGSCSSKVCLEFLVLLILLTEGCDLW